MRKVLAIIGSAIFLLIAPGFVVGLVPWWISHWALEPAFFGQVSIPIAGAVLLGLGVIGLLDSFARFAVEGVGTREPTLPNAV